MREKLRLGELRGASKLKDQLEERQGTGTRDWASAQRLACQGNQVQKTGPPRTTVGSQYLIKAEEKVNPRGSGIQRGSVFTVAWPSAPR